MLRKILFLMFLIHCGKSFDPASSRILADPPNIFQHQEQIQTGNNQNSYQFQSQGQTRDFSRNTFQSSSTTYQSHQSTYSDDNLGYAPPHTTKPSQIYYPSTTPSYSENMYSSNSYDSQRPNKRPEDDALVFKQTTTNNYNPYNNPASNQNFAPNEDQTTYQQTNRYPAAPAHSQNDYNKADEPSVNAQDTFVSTEKYGLQHVPDEDRIVPPNKQENIEIILPPTLVYDEDDLAEATTRASILESIKKSKHKTSTENYDQNHRQ